MRPVLDLRTYKLVLGGRETFDRIFREGALPMLRRHEIDVVGYGASLVDDEHYYLARAFRSASGREQQLRGFYGSEEWRQRYERAVMELIETYHTVVIPLTPGIGQALASGSSAREPTGKDPT